MDRTITFRELVRLIHPDVNPHIENAGGKMRNAVLFKDQPEELYKLGIRWGVVTGSTPTQPEPEDSWESGQSQRVHVPPSFRETRLARERRERAERLAELHRVERERILREHFERERLRRVERERVRQTRERIKRNRQQTQRPVPTYQRWDATKPLIWKDYPNENPTVNGFVFVHTQSRIRVQVVRVTPKRVYFFNNGRRTFANRKNVSVARQVRD